MSGRRSWGGYGWALGLALALGCSSRPVVPPPEPAAETDPATETATKAAATAPPSAGEPSEATLRLKGIKLVEDEGQTGVFLKVSRAPDKVEHFTLANPSRLVIDMRGPASASQGEMERAAVDDPLVSRVRVAKRDVGLRVIVDLKKPAPKCTVSDVKDLVVAFVGERTGKAGPPKSQVLYAETDGGTPARVVTAPAPAAAGARAEVAVADPAPPHAQASGTALKTYRGQKISLDFKDADILNVLRILAEVGGKNIVATDDVKGRVTVRLVDVPWDQALDIVLQSNRLDTVEIGNVIRVSTITRLKEEREAQLAAAEAAKELEPLETAYINVNYMRVNDKNDPLIPKLKDVISDRGKVQVDERTNTVIVHDIERGIAAARELVLKLDLQTPEVLIESNIVEGNDSFQRDLGIQWGYSYGIAPQFGNATGREFPSSIILGGASPLGQGAVPGTGPAALLPQGTNSGPTIGAAGLPSVPIPFVADFPARTVAAGEGTAFDIALGSIDGSKALNARLTALEKEGKGKIISRPKIVTLNNIIGRIEAFRIFRVRLPGTGTVISTAPGGVAGSATAATEQIKTGISLEVKPQVSSDGFILLEIKVKSSTADFTQQVDNIPAEITREAFSNVLIKEGETVVLGGVFRDDSQNNESGIPYLRSLPVFGWLFKRLFKNSQREELLVFITPRLVRGGATLVSQPTARELWDHRPQ